MTDVKRLKLAQSAYIVPTEITQPWGYFLEPDKMKVSDNYTEQLALCRFFANKDAIAAGIINKQVDLGFNGYKPLRSDCTDEEFSVYDSISETIRIGLKLMAREYLISGLLVPEIIWKKISGKDLGLKGRPNKAYQVPDAIWLRDPALITLKASPIPTKARVFLTVPFDDVYFILNNGKYQDGTQDKELYTSLVQNYPDYVKAVKAGQTTIPLSNSFLLRRNVDAGKIYPTPYLLPALESLQHKRNLKKMDYSIAARVISAIMLVKLGSDKFPLTEDDQPLIDELKTQMTWRNRPDVIERVFQLFANHTLTIDWVFPPTEALLEEKKYTSVNQDILHALGIPAIISTGETQRSGSSQAEFALLPPTEVLKSLRKDLTPFIKHLYMEMRDLNGFNNYPTPNFTPIKLYDPAKAAAMGKDLHDSGALSQTTWDALIDADWEEEQIIRKSETDFQTKLGLDTQPAVPFSSPSIGKNGQNNKNSQNQPK